MAYFLKSQLLGVSPSLALSADEFLAVQSSMSEVLEYLRLEESWDILVGNAFALEREALELSLTQLVYDESDAHTFQDARTTFSRHMQNLLSSARSYLDQTPQVLSRIDPKEALTRKFHQMRNAAYDGSFEYRLMEGLRNHAQHHGHPVHGAMFDTRRLEVNQGTFWRYVVGATINIEELAADPKVKRTVIDEAREKGDRIDALELTRSYLQSLNEIHISIRCELEHLWAVHRAVVRDALAKYEAAGGEPIAVQAYEAASEGERSRVMNVVEFPFERLARLISKNGSLRNFASRYVSSEIYKRHHV